MTTAPLNPGSGVVAGWAVRSGLGLATWGIRRASRRTDRDRQLDRLAARAAAEAALVERDALLRSARFTAF
ncbi:hypothetical protein FLP10_02065 [Agromyces intestinalis]|uniref:Uncharacterized protein n=1 Tax=Agromyces intestinalis TaxID=2592652 RepID=A0A5C1YD67_9MICO|nr:hypothetical protein [Agromyces intestinalis]QEO13335.1 hypothetical protein FLP10_02065 [Agromyces intestinalis]